MKTIKYFFVGAFLAVGSAQAMAQDVNAEIEAITKVIVDNKDNAAALKQPVKDFEKLHKKDADALAGLGRAYLSIKDMDNAMKYADLAIKANKSKAAGYILKGDISAINENGGEAAMWYQTATINDPKDPQGYIKYARVYQKVDAAGAEGMLRKLTDIDPNYPVDAEIAHMYYFNQKYQKAFDNYQKVDIAKLDDGKITEYALSAYLLGKYKEGAEAAEYGAKKYPRKAGLNRLTSFCYTELGEFEKALDYADRLFNKSDSAKFTGRDYIYNARALKGAGKHTEAINMFKTAYEQDNSLNEILKMMSESYQETKDFDNAVAYYKKYMESMEQQKATDYTALATIYQTKAEATEGEEKKAALIEADRIYTEVAEKFDTYKVYSLYQRANIHHAINPNVKAGEAKPYYEELANTLEEKADKKSGDIKMLSIAYNYLCVYFIQNDDVDQAKAYATKLQEIQPDNDTAKQILAL